MITCEVKQTERQGALVTKTRTCSLSLSYLVKQNLYALLRFVMIPIQYTVPLNYQLIRVKDFISLLPLPGKPIARLKSLSSRLYYK